MLSLRNAALRLLDAIQHATVATVSSGGEPWNTPVYFARHGRAFFWISRADAQHSINIRANGRVFIAIYDSSREDTSAAAVYIDADAHELTDEPSITAALTRIFQRRQKPVPAVMSVRPPSSQRAYVAVARKAWTNVVHTNEGNSWDERVDLALE